MDSIIKDTKGENLANPFANQSAFSLFATPGSGFYTEPPSYPSPNYPSNPSYAQNPFFVAQQPLNPPPLSYHPLPSSPLTMIPLIGDASLMLNLVSEDNRMQVRSRMLNFKRQMHGYRR